MKKSMKLISLLLIFVLLLTACSSKKSSENVGNYDGRDSGFEPGDLPRSEESKSDYGDYEPEYAPGVESPAEIANPPEYKDRKVVVTYEVRIQTKEFDKASELLMDRVKEYGGYIEQYDHYRDPMKEYSLQSVQLKVRIPKDKSDGFMKSLGEVGSLGQTSIRQDDKTEQYFDQKSRVESLEAQLKQLQELYEKATEMEDILIIQQKISDVLYDIEQIKGSLRKIDDLTDFSTFYIDMAEVKEYTPTVEVKESLGTRIKNAFIAMTENVKEGFENFLINIVYFLPTLVVLLFLLVVVLILIKVLRKRKFKWLRWRRKERKLQEEKEEVPEEENTEE